MAAIQLADICIAVHCLPRAGGLLDQDPLDIIAIQSVRECQTELENKRVEAAKRGH